MEEYVFFVTFAQSITFELIIFVVCMINELSSARAVGKRLLKRRTTVVLSDLIS